MMIVSHKADWFDNEYKFINEIYKYKKNIYTNLSMQYLKQY